jgi:hypothetical protein
VAHNPTTTQKRKRGRPPGLRPAPKIARDPPRLDDLAAWSITEFCRQNMMSRSFYYVLRQSGQGPKETRLGSKVLISRKAAADWLARREKQSAVPA